MNQAHTLPKSAAGEPTKTPATVFPIIFAIATSHLLNDTIQSLIPATYPVIKDSLALNFAQIGLITLCFQITASILQPVVGWYTDKKPKPFSLAVGMASSGVGLIMLSLSNSYALVLISVVFVGLGSSVFHPEASRVAHLAAGKRRGLAQSIFQVGGNLGHSLGPLLAAFVIAGRDHSQTMWFVPLALIGIVLLFVVGRWYKTHLAEKAASAKTAMAVEHGLSKTAVILSLSVLILLLVSKYFYTAGLTSYFTFYLMDKFDLSVGDAQLHVFIYLFAFAVGTFIGGPVGDRIGRKYVIWASILGSAPFTLILPYAGLELTTILIIPIGIIMASAFSAILIYAQELLPGRVGLVSGIFYGLAFGLGGIGSAVLGIVADHTSIEFVYQVCAFLPLLGLFAIFLPDLKARLKRR